MSSMTLFILFVSIIAILFLVLNLLFAPHNPYAEKFSSFECGFHSFLGQNRSQFNIKFFIFGLVFLLFDLEITLVFPFAVSQSNNEIYGLIIVLIFLVIITIGFVYELGKGALKIDSKQNIGLLSGSSTNISISYVEKEVQRNKGSSTFLYFGGGVIKNIRPLHIPTIIGGGEAAVGTKKRFYSSNGKGSKDSLYVRKLRRSPNLFEFGKILSKNILRFVCLMPFILAFKSLYSCFHNDNWTFIYFYQQFLTHIPFIGSYLLHLLNEQGLLPIDLIKNNQYIGNLIFSGSFGASIGKALFELFWDKDKLLMGDFSDETLRCSKGGIDKNRGFFMQADNTQTGKPESSQEDSSKGVSSTYYSLDFLNKLLEERNKILSDSRKLILGTGSSSSNLPVTQTDKMKVVTHLMDIRQKNYEALEEFIKTHTKFMDFSYFVTEIKPLIDQIDAIWGEFYTNIAKISLSDPNYLKKQTDLENNLFKKHMGIGLEIEKKLFAEVQNMDKRARLPQGFLADYKENIQKAWIRERESFSAEQKKLRKELGEMLDKKA